MSAMDPFEPRDPFDSTPPIEREMKSWIANYFRAQAAQAMKEASA